ncbi:ATP-binding protein [Streptomyces sp. ISL-99]|uniref:AlbA family DNA-binding domain-containing protein n=1 Tax=Streptomyces sp. ISL-99 TaxID=2819193 RepID=UPI001BEB2D3F|nr:ATP-binding protein [Streptomyces sp. ISL-99]MBT2526984.1 ATP-binding protein [Streptomyces sp. ISL-99]
MTFRSRRLEELLGGTLDAITYGDIARLVGNIDAAEAEDLDYKQAHYTGEDKSREELAKDVAAFANHLGGVLIIGMAENRGVPSKVFDVPLDDAHLRDLHQRIASSTAPMVRWHHMMKENPDRPGHGFLIIAVPRSPQAPHAITLAKGTTGALRYPRRSGSQTDWLTETYVATAYQQRFTALADRRSRMKEIQQELVAQETDRNLPHLLTTLVPHVPGDMRITQQTFAAYQPALRQAQPLLGQDTRPFKAVNVQAGGLMLHYPQARSRSDLAHLYTDGSGIWAQPLPSVFDDDEPDERLRVLRADVLVHRLLSALALLGAHARDRCGATGTVSIEVDLVDCMYSHPYAPPEPYSRPGQTRPDPACPLLLQQERPFPPSEFPCGSAQAEASALLDDLADTGTGLVQTGSLLTDQLFHAFGIAEAAPVTGQGEIRLAAWGQSLRAAITNWADQQGVALNRPVS